MSLEPPRPRHRDLATALRGRDADATARLLDEHGGALRGFLAEALRNPSDREDVLQQTLTEAWQRGPSYAPERGSIATWLLMIARSRTIDHLRRRVPEPLDPTSVAEPADPAAEAEIETLAERWRIAALLSEIPREEARILALRFHGGLSQREIADRTGIALGTVKMRMARGLERLRVALEREEESP